MGHPQLVVAASLDSNREHPLEIGSANHEGLRSRRPFIFLIASACYIALTIPKNGFTKRLFRQEKAIVHHRSSINELIRGVRCL